MSIYIYISITAVAQRVAEKHISDPRKYDNTMLQMKMLFSSTKPSHVAGKKVCSEVAEKKVGLEVAGNKVDSQVADKKVDSHVAGKKVDSQVARKEVYSLVSEEKVNYLLFLNEVFRSLWHMTYNILQVIYK